MTDSSHPLILYVPGLLPKPEPELHRDALRRCLLAALRRVDEDVATAVETTPGAFDIVSWTYDFYREHRDFALDAESVEAVIAKEKAGAQDIAEATSWKRSLTRGIYQLGDMLPFLIPHVASERMEVHLRDLRRYKLDDNGIATHTRRMLKMALRAATEADQPILLIGHRMGSVIVYDCLWEMSYEGDEEIEVDLLITMGSPLGQRFMQKRLKGAERAGRTRYPKNIRRWKNFSAIGDLTALDPDLADDFSAMVHLGLVEEIADEFVHTHFRLDGRLNVHSEYGYLVNERTAHTVAHWWRGHSSPGSSSP